MMFKKQGAQGSTRLSVPAFLVAIVFSAVFLMSASGTALAAAEGETGARLVVPMIDSAKGKRLFVERGCVLCHSVNKVGGLAGPPLDATGPGQYVDLLDFMARMWRGAFAMIELQGMELGYQLDFTGEELGHIAAFLADGAAQERFGEQDVPGPDPGHVHPREI